MADTLGADPRLAEIVSERISRYINMKTVRITGIGMGTEESLTKEASQALAEAREINTDGHSGYEAGLSS